MPLPPGAEQDEILRQVTGELQDKGFVIANVDKLGQLGPHRVAVADDVWSGLLRHRNDACLRQPLRLWTASASCRGQARVNPT